MLADKTSNRGHDAVISACPASQNLYLSDFARDNFCVRGESGPIHWAGTETATQWMGYLDGAVESADRATAEVLAAPR
jgi:hypothetical protein